MARGLSGNSAKVVNVSSWRAYLVGILALMLCLSGNESAQATTGGSPYEVPQVVDINSAGNVVET